MMNGDLTDMDTKMKTPPTSAPTVITAKNKADEINRGRKEAQDRLARLNSKVYKAFLDMEKATFCDGDLSKKNKELIAMAIGVAVNCESCMQWHMEQAKKEGATINEVLEAIEVAIEMGSGPVTVNARFALEMMENYFGKI
jgi:AhpD family alkylhydroperoxidase